MKIRSVLPIALLCVFMLTGPASAETIYYDTIVITNEGGLIDKLSATGSVTLYDVLTYLQPLSGGAISQGFLNALPAGSEVFGGPDGAYLSYFTGYMSSEGVNGDGTVFAQAIFGGDISKYDSGFTTYSTPITGLGSVHFTSTNAAYYLYVGTAIYRDGVLYQWQPGDELIETDEIRKFRATAIVWASPETTAVPEPASLLLLGLGLIGLSEVKRKSKK